MSNRMKLGWFNAWVGYASIVLLIPSFLFFFSYETFLQRSFAPVLVSQFRIEIKSDSSEMKIINDKGTFYHYNKANYQIITDCFSTGKPVEIWVGKDSNNTVNYRINDEFILNRSKLGKVLYLIGLIVSGSMVVLSTILIIKTKGWGTYELMEKHRKKDIYQ